ncbi:Efflux pump periplasmic linker BepF [Sphingobacterium mizutaii]|uniref:Efflux pump periplasmic linker BepF n=1 Tax=Sphingobacterium mizutaii TaxID=1010 RepID=A0AAJ4XA02_9SPHI|nr:efflux RND transporter periplasmic adaptor subunit [Sphingobacterium mizutaii]SDK87844.1 RND family efflux transporter, MFP subunit [Sphingobacterium mizutaii]SNV46240.1 Efflux pump periplasmic linker BepF [Sphingobacterium mizutaii]
MKTILTSISFLALLGSLSSCSNQAEQKKVELPAISATIGQTAGSNQGKYVTASGKIEAENSAMISTRLMGFVTDITVKTGQKVSQGQLLARISSNDLAAKKAQAEAGIAQANAGYNNARKDYERFEALFAQKSASQKELDDMSTRMEMAKAGLEAAKQMRNEVMAQFSYSNITAPFSGVITGTFMKKGDMANPGMPIISMEGASKLQAVVMVSESEILNIKNGMKADVTIKSTQKTIKGRVAEMSSSAQNTGGQYIVKINLDEPAQILSGMFVQAVFPIERSASAESATSMTLIPKEAIIEEGQLKGIYVLNDQNIALLRWVRLGKTYGNDVEVLSGLSENEKYVLKADGRLFNGVQIKAK